MNNLRYRIKASESGFFFFVKQFYYKVRKFSLPAPKIVWTPIWESIKFLRNVYYWSYRTFWVTPIYKGFCVQTGRRFRAGAFLPYIIGKGNIYIGDNVVLHGKIDFIFGSIRTHLPEIHIGHNTGIGHNVRFDISSTLSIGENCLIAKDVAFHDSSGHHIDPLLRKNKVRITEKQIRPIVVGNNVWIGDGAYITPGTQIGDNCVISANTTVGRKIPPNSIVYHTPAKIMKIRNISDIV